MKVQYNKRGARYNESGNQSPATPIWQPYSNSTSTALWCKCYSSEAQKMINATAAAMTDDVVRPGRSLGGAAEDTPLVLVAPVAAAPDGWDWDGVVSPSTLDALPKSELAKLHNWRMLFTNEGKLGVFRTAVWFVRSKLDNRT